MTCQNKRKEDIKGYRSRVVKVHGSRCNILNMIPPSQYN